ERDIGYVGRALGVGRAAEDADTLALAIGGVARERAVPPAQLVATARDDARNAAEVLVARRRHLEHTLDRLVVGRKPLGRQIGKPQLARAAVEHALGCAEAGARVDGGGAADGAPKRDHEGRVADGESGPHVPIELALERQRMPGELLALDPFAFLEDEDR